MSLLIFTPTWELTDGLRGLQPECAASIEAQDYDDFEWRVSTANLYPTPDHRNVLHQYRLAQQIFLAGPWAAMLTIEHDNALPDVGAVRRLMDTPGDVIYAPYLLRHGSPTLSTYQYINDRNLGMTLSNYPDELRMARAGNIWRVSGAGMGCTLFHRHVLESIEFEATGERNPCPDLGFAENALRKGLVSMARFDVPVWHFHNGAWLHPYGETTMAKYLAVQTVRAMADGRAITLKAGAEIELTEAEAYDLIRVGQVTPINVADPIAPPDLKIDATLAEVEHAAAAEPIEERAPQIAAAPPTPGRKRKVS